MIIHVRTMLSGTGAMLVALAVCPALCTSVHAQVLLSPGFEEPTAADAKPGTATEVKPDPAEPSKTKFRLHPAAEPDPALRYRLWPSVASQRSDDAVPFITRALLLQRQAIHANDASARDFTENFNRFSEAALDELPLEELRSFVTRYGETALQELSRAENRMGSNYDLSLHELSLREAVSVLLPEIQETRSLARLLQLRIRLAMAEGRWDDAIDDLRLGMRLSEFAGRSTNLIISRLVGFAIAGVMLGTMEEAIRQPDCPNLYWALATVPVDRLFEIGDAVEYELDLIGRFGGSGSVLPNTPIGAESARRRMFELVGSLASATDWDSSIADSRESVENVLWLSIGAFTILSGDRARQILAETTPWGEQAHELSIAEAVLRAALLKISRIQDTQVKWMLLPQPQSSEHIHKVESAVKEAMSMRDPVTALVVGLLSPASTQARAAGGRSERQLHLLVTLEALRMHAASHGELPESLEQLDPVPAWNDPVTTQPFSYQRTSATTATLQRPPRWTSDRDTEIQIELAKQGDLP